MRKALLLILAVTLGSVFLFAPEFLQGKKIAPHKNSQLTKLASSTQTTAIAPANTVKEMLEREAPRLSNLVISKVLATLSCAKEHQLDHNNILTIIDYSLPSSEKRLWVFDLHEKKLLFYTYVSHGIKSGALLTNYFSNKYNSKASSIGIFKTEKAYHGREGLSLKLDGFDKGFNDNASNRSVVMHGGWYVNEHFIKKYGRPGRSWGCPTLPLELAEPIINTIKDQSLFVVYYPNNQWFSKSKFLNCHNLYTLLNITILNRNKLSDEPLPADADERESILLADTSKHEEDKSVLAMPADNYEQTFHTKPPLERMLRRQIDNVEYIALSNAEFKILAMDHDNKDRLNMVYFVMPVIKMSRGYYLTEMKIINLGKITSVQPNTSFSSGSTQLTGYKIYFESKPAVNLRATNRFIRWLGL